MYDGEQEQTLPSKLQIAAISDVDALNDIRDAIERTIVHIETQLEFSGGVVDSWARAAQGALALHRYVDRLIRRRIATLDAASADEIAIRPDDANSPLTLEVLAKRPNINPSDFATIEDVEAKAQWLVERIEAVREDREDEIGQKPGERDEKFLAATGSLLRSMNWQRSNLQNRRGEIRKAEKASALKGQDDVRERLFIRAAQEVLDRDTYLRIWAVVERVHPQALLPPTEISERKRA